MLATYRSYCGPKEQYRLMLKVQTYFVHCLLQDILGFQLSMRYYLLQPTQMPPITYIQHHMHAPGQASWRGYRKPVEEYPSVQSCTGISKQLCLSGKASCMICLEITGILPMVYTGLLPCSTPISRLSSGPIGLLVLQPKR